MKKSHELKRLDPTAGIPGGEITVEYSALSSGRSRSVEVWFGDAQAHVVAAGSQRSLVLVPALKRGGQVEVTLRVENDKGKANSIGFISGKKLAEDLHPVANPAFDPGDGSLFVTRSGSRGEHIPVTLFRITTEGDVEEFSGDITNPTGIAFDRNGQMYITSRFDSTVYRVSPLKEVAAFATDLGIATGLAFNRDGDLFVGDRSGTINRINEIGEASPWAQLEPSVSAYHLAFGPDDALYVAGPTVSSFDAIMRIDEDGEAGIFYQGLGRPQGLAFDREGNLYVAASLRGRRGIVRISPDATEANIVVAGMNLVGLAFSAGGEMVVATNDTIYTLPLEIYGTLLD